MVYVVKNNDKYSIRKLTGAEYDAMNPLKLDIVKLMAFKKQLIENEEHLITMKGDEYLKLPIMLHDKIMKEYTDIIIHNFNKDIIICPISDVHFGALGHNEKAWNNFCKWVEKEENVYLTLGGDLINNGTKNSVSGPFDDIVRPREQKRRMAEMLMLWSLTRSIAM